MKALNESSITLTVPEARRIFEYLDGPCRLDRLERRLADRIADDLGLPRHPERPATESRAIDWTELLEII